jgi:hypothetical protein
MGGIELYPTGVSDKSWMHSDSVQKCVGYGDLAKGGFGAILWVLHPHRKATEAMHVVARAREFAESPFGSEVCGVISDGTLGSPSFSTICGLWAL